jgi:hypothetical protein
MQPGGEGKGCDARWEQRGCEGRGSCTSEKQLGISAALSLTPACGFTARSSCRPRRSWPLRGSAAPAGEAAGRSDSLGTVEWNPLGEGEMENRGRRGSRDTPGVPIDLWTGPARVPQPPRPGTLPSPRERDPEVKPLGSQPSAAAAPRPALPGTAARQGLPALKRAQEGNGGGEGEVPRGQRAQSDLAPGGARS